MSFWGGLKKILWEQLLRFKVPSWVSLKSRIQVSSPTQYSLESHSTSGFQRASGKVSQDPSKGEAVNCSVCRLGLPLTTQAVLGKFLDLSVNDSSTVREQYLPCSCEEEINWNTERAQMMPDYKRVWLIIILIPIIITITSSESTKPPRFLSFFF